MAIVETVLTSGPVPVEELNAPPLQAIQSIAPQRNHRRLLKQGMAPPKHGRRCGETIEHEPHEEEWWAWTASAWQRKNPDQTRRISVIGTRGTDRGRRDDGCGVEWGQIRPPRRGRSRRSSNIGGSVSARGRELLLNWHAIKQRKQNFIAQNNERENAKRIAHEYNIGNKVLLSKYNARKLECPNEGPYVITEVHNNGQSQ